MDLELDCSITNRNVALEAELLNRYYNKFVNKYIDEIEILSGSEDFFTRDDSFHNIKSPQHIIYKLKTDENGATHLLSKDGNRGYEFVIEFDKKDSAYGIYYGCKGLILGGEQEEQINVFIKEWESIKDEVSYILNNTFPDKNFHRRYKPTNNANNKTFWPFWIPLYEEEDITKVAARAVKIIYNVYKLRIINEVKLIDKINLKKLAPSDQSRTAYTDERYMSILNELNKHNPENGRLYTTFLENATELEYLEKDTRYERCWRVKNMKNIEVYYLIQEFFECLSSDKYLNNKWDLFQPILLSSKGNPIDLKRSKSTSTNESNKDRKRRDEEAKERINKILDYSK